MLSIVSSLFINIGFSASWSYVEEGTGINDWSSLVAECGYNRQSPIDIPLDSSKTCEKPLELQWTSEYSHYAIRNNGHSLQAIPFAMNYNGGSDISGLEVLSHNNDTNIRLQNSFYHTYESMINREYCFDSLHFHWGSSDDDGSEHTVNGEEYPLEVHLVHYSCDYKVAGDAINDYATGKANVKYDDANVLAVIGVIFEIGEPNHALTKILDDIIVDGIYNGKSTSDVGQLELFYTEFDLKELLPQSREMIAYLGSLTTPPCYETVRWHVMKEKMTVSEEQMELFRLLLTSADTNDSMAPNFRPTMPLNNRKIYQCHEDLDDDALYTDPEDKYESLSAEDGDDMSTDEMKWRMIAIAFIIVSVLTLVVCLIVSVVIYRNWQKIYPSQANGHAMDKHIKSHEKSETDKARDDDLAVISGGMPHSSRM